MFFFPHSELFFFVFPLSYCKEFYMFKRISSFFALVS